MRTLDYSPLFRSSIGFDRMVNALEAASRVDHQVDNWPPYDIVKTGEDDYRISMALAGFDQPRALAADSLITTRVES